MNDVKEGSGIYTYSDGAIYEGDYKDNSKSGKGKFTYVDKSVYEGDFVDG